MMKLYTYWRSSSSYRVRIALHLKGLAYAPQFVHLVRGGGEQHAADYRKLNPQGRVPALQDGATTLTQSLAIIEYLDEMHPDPPLLPTTALERAQVRALAQLIACDIQPHQNTSTTVYLRDVLGASKPQVDAWLANFIGKGLLAVEALLASRVGYARRGDYCHGDLPGLADCLLVPQCYAARRFGLALDDGRFPRITVIEAACQALPAFQRAAPEAQPDRE